LPAVKLKIQRRKIVSQVQRGTIVVWYNELNSPSVLTVQRRFGTESSRNPPKIMFTYM